MSDKDSSFQNIISILGLVSCLWQPWLSVLIVQG